MRLDGDTAEVMRLFVDPAARGGGVGRAIMQVIETTARTEGIRTLLLETGVKSFEALGLYRDLGFTECGPFAAYGPDPFSVFMAKPLALASVTCLAMRALTPFRPRATRTF